MHILLYPSQSAEMILPSYDSCIPEQVVLSSTRAETRLIGALQQGPHTRGGLRFEGILPDRVAPEGWNLRLPKLRRLLWDLVDEVAHNNLGHRMDVANLDLSDVVLLPYPVVPPFYVCSFLISYSSLMVLTRTCSNL